MTLSTAATIALLSALGAGGVYAGEEGIRHGFNSADEDDIRANFKANIIAELDKQGKYTGNTRAFIDNADNATLYSIAKANGLLDTSKTLFGESDSLYDSTYSDVAEYISKLGELESEMPTMDDALQDILKGEDALTNAYLKELSKSEERQTNLFQNQLQENQMAFDDYRSQLLGNQYQQNAQLMGSVDSAMSKARRNALEAGASAGLRMAENINTTLALQNKQAQTSLETSNQLAQQLLNQRQAAAGIRGDYNQMLDRNSSERRNYIQQSADRVYNERKTDWENSFSNTSNPYGELYRENLRNKNTQNKQSSQYNN